MNKMSQPSQEPLAAASQAHARTAPDTTATATTATVAGPQGEQGPVDIDQGDVQYWINSFNEAAADPNGHINSKSPAGASSWTNSFWHCLSPIETCLMGCFLPCVTFSRTYHRLHKDEHLKDWQPVNATVSYQLSWGTCTIYERKDTNVDRKCLMYCGSSFFLPLWAIPIAMQRAVIRSKFNLQGGCLSDMAWGCCCGCCSIVQMEKEVIDQQQNAITKDNGYQPERQMVIPIKQ